MKNPIGFVAALALGICCGLFAGPNAVGLQRPRSSAGVDNLRDFEADIHGLPVILTESRFLRLPSPEEQRIDRALACTVSYDVHETALSEVLASLERQVGVPFRIDKTTISDEGVDWDDIRISGVTKDVPLRDAFQNMLAPYQLAALKDGDEVVITSAIGCSWPFTKIYPAADLVSVPIPGGIEMRHAELIDLITSTIDRDSWDSSIQFDAVTLSFRIHQLSGYHAQILEFLTRLRQLRQQAPTLVRTVGRSNPDLQSKNALAHHRQKLVFIERDLQELAAMEARNQPLGFAGGLGGGGIFNVSGNDPVDPSPNEYARPTWYEIAARARRLSLRAMLVALEVAEGK